MQFQNGTSNGCRLLRRIPLSNGCHGSKNVVGRRSAGGARRGVVALAGTGARAIGRSRSVRRCRDRVASVARFEREDSRRIIGRSREYGCPARACRGWRPEKRCAATRRGSDRGSHCAGRRSAARHPFGPADRAQRRDRRGARRHRRSAAIARRSRRSSLRSGRAAARGDERRRADLAAGRRMELDALCGAVVRMGREHGVPTPLNLAVVAVLRPHERKAAAAHAG